jgi:hypothetical protein
MEQMAGQVCLSPNSTTGTTELTFSEFSVRRASG